MLRRPVEVRPAGIEDVELLLQLAQHTADEASLLLRRAGVPSRQRLTAALARDDVEVHVALAGAEPVGVVVLRTAEVLPLAGSPAVHVDRLWVRPSWRHRGVARQLLGAAVAAAERAGAEDVVCTAPPGGRDALRFLARLGFAPLVTARAVPTARLRARLLADRADGRRRAALDQLLARRRRQLDRPAEPGQAGGSRTGATAAAPAAAPAAVSAAARRAGGT